MIAHSVSALASGINATTVDGPLESRVRHLTQDSRTVHPGSLFFAVSGLHVDGHGFVEQAVDNGAVAVVHERSIAAKRPGVAYIRVHDSRRAMSRIASAFYHEPSRELTVIGVTGTDGKSTTASFIHQLLEAQGVATGLLSTVQLKTGEHLESNPFRQSTPEAIQIQDLLHRMVRSGKTHVVVEATSHGLSRTTSRLADVVFDVGVFTNLSPEHLEFHRTMEQYRDDKANLFRALPCGVNGSFGVVNEDDENAAFFRDVAAAPVFGFSLREGLGDVWARDVSIGSTESQFYACSATGCVSTRLPVPGSFNVENALAALLTVSHVLKIGIDTLAPALARLRGIPGRLSPVRAGQPFGVIVDFAHTPGAFAKLLPTMRRRTSGKLIVVFGSAGERDRAKRPLQGALAARYADRVVLTDEDPRGEDPMAILKEIASGAEGMRQGAELSLIPDRREAIRAAMRMAQADDMVLLLGKGHESSIAHADGSLPWDEASVARETLAELGYAAPVP